MFRFLILMKLFGGDKYKNKSLGSLTLGDVADAYFGYVRVLVIVIGLIVFVCSLLAFGEIMQKHDEKVWAKEEKTEAKKQAAIHAEEVKKTGGVPDFDVTRDPYLWEIYQRYGEILDRKELRLSRLHEIADKKTPMDKKTKDEMSLLEKQKRFCDAGKMDILEQYNYALFKGVGSAQQRAIWKHNFEALKKEYITGKFL